MYKKIMLAIGFLIQMTTMITASFENEEPNDLFGVILQSTQDVYLNQAKLTAKLEKVYDLEHGSKNKSEGVKQNFIDCGLQAAHYLKKHEELKYHIQRVHELSLKMMIAKRDEQKALLDAYDQEEIKYSMSLKTRKIFNQFYRQMVLLDFEQPKKEESIKFSSFGGSVQGQGKRLVASYSVQKYPKNIQKK